MARRLLVLNGLAAIAVVLHHAAAYGLQAMFEWTAQLRGIPAPNYDQLGSLPYYVLITIRHLDGYALPAFLFVSGFFIAFLARGSDSTVPWKTVTPRIKTLLPPFIIWTMIRFVMLRQIPDNIDHLLDPYHFIPVLIQFYLLSPLLVPLARKRWKLLLIGAATLQLSFIVASYLNAFGLEIAAQQWIRSLPRWIFTQYAFWFPFGLVAGIHVEKLSQWTVKARRGLLVAFILVAVLTIVEYEIVDRLNGEQWIGPTFRGLTGLLYPLAFILCFLGFERTTIPFSKKISWLGTKSLGIYMANIPAIYVVAVVLYDMAPWVLEMQLLYQPLLIAAGIGGPLLLISMMNWKPFTRAANRYVFG